MEGRKRKAYPGRIRIGFRDDAVGAMPLDLPQRRMWPVGLWVGAGFAIFAAIAWTTGADIAELRR